MTSERRPLAAPGVPPRTVGFFGVALLPVNGMIGAGIFALPAALVGAVGGFAPWQILIGGFVFLPLVLTFGWLAAHFEGSGGPVLFGKTAFGPFLGFQAGWARYAAGTVAVAANTHVMISYFAALFPLLEAPLLHSVTVVLVILGLTLLCILGMRQSVTALGVLTALKLLPLVALVVSAAAGSYRSVPFVLPEFSQVESVLLLSFYAFIGFETATMPAGEMRRPKRDLPRALVAMLAMVTLVYMAVIWAFGVIAPAATDSGNALADAAMVSLGPIGSLAIVLAAGFSIAANTLSGIVTIPRMAFLAICLSCWIASHASARSWVIFAALVGLGTLLYFLAQRALGPAGTAARQER